MIATRQFDEGQFEKNRRAEGTERGFSPDAVLSRQLVSNDQNRPSRYIVINTGAMRCARGSRATAVAAFEEKRTALVETAEPIRPTSTCRIGGHWSA